MEHRPSDAQLIPQSRQQIELIIKQDEKRRGYPSEELNAPGDWYIYPQFPGCLSAIVGQVYRIEAQNNVVQIYKITNRYFASDHILVQVSWDWYLRSPE